MSSIKIGDAVHAVLVDAHVHDVTTIGEGAQDQGHVGAGANAAQAQEEGEKSKDERLHFDSKMCCSNEWICELQGKQRESTLAWRLYIAVKE